MQRHANAVMRDDRGMTLLGCFAALFIPMVSTHTIMMDRRRRRTKRHFTYPCNPFLLNILAIHILFLRYVLHQQEEKRLSRSSSLIPPITLIWCICEALTWLSLVTHRKTNPSPIKIRSCAWYWKGQGKAPWWRRKWRRRRIFLVVGGRWLKKQYAVRPTNRETDGQWQTLMKKKEEWKFIVDAPRLTSPYSLLLVLGV